MKERLKHTIILFPLLCLLLGLEKDSLKNILTDIQYEVTQNCGTEPPFKNEYWNNKEDGIYIDIITGVPLFSSLHKYNSGTGWCARLIFELVGDCCRRKDVVFLKNPQSQT